MLSPKEFNTSFSDGGFAGPYTYMGREVLLSEVSSASGESILSMELDFSAGCDYRYSFLFYPVETAKNTPAIIFEIRDIVKVTQDDFTACGAFWIEFAGERKFSPDYSLITDNWNGFELLILADGSSVLLVNGRYMGGRKPSDMSPDKLLKLSMGCEKSQARFMWDKLLFETLDNQDLRLCDYALIKHGFFQSVLFRNPDMNMLFDGRCVRGDDLYTQGDWQYPGFQRGSTLYNQPLTDMDELACFGVRWHGPAGVSPDSNRIELHCHRDYDIEVHRAGGKVTAFSTTSTTSFSPLQGTSTYYLFTELPGVVFCNSYVENISNETRLSTATTPITYMMFTQGERDIHGNPHTPAYDGFRLWPKAEEQVSFHYSLSEKSVYAKADEIDTDNGVFVKWNRNNIGFYGVWFTGDTNSLGRGLAVMQKDGKNDWEANPPIGNIFSKDIHYGTFTSYGDEYVSMASSVYLQGDMSVPGNSCENEIIFFSLKPECPINSEESLYNLERSFNLPPAIRISPLQTGVLPTVSIRELDGIDRTWQIVSLPWVFGDMEFKNGVGDIYPGCAYTGRKPVKTVILLKDVEANAEIFLGNLPITLGKEQKGTWTVESGLGGLIHNVWIHIDCELPALRSVSNDKGEIKAWRVNEGRLEICMDLEHGTTTITFH